MSNDPTQPIEPGRGGPPPGYLPPQGPPGGPAGGPPPGGVPAGPGFAPSTSRPGAGFVAVAAVGAIVAGVVAFVGSWVGTTQRPANPFAQSVGLSIWPWYGQNDTSQIYQLFGIQMAAVVVIGFLLLMVATRAVPGARSWPVVFFATWWIVGIAAVIGAVVATQASDLDLYRGADPAFRACVTGMMWAMVAGWIPAVFTATANAMRRG